MNKNIQEKLELFVDNYQNIKGDFIWQEGMAKRLAALAYAIEGKKIDTDAIRTCHNMLKSETGVFSSFRGNLSIFMAASLSLHEQPSHVLSDTLRVHELLRSVKFWQSDYLAVTAYEIAVNAERGRFERVVQRTREFFDEMKANHRFLICKDDYIFAAMLALSDIEPHAGALKLKRLFLDLKSEFSFFTGKNSVLTLCKMLVLGGSTAECEDRLLRLNRAFKKRKISFDKTYTLPSLGVLTMLDVDGNTLADELISARDYLRAQKGFGVFSVDNQELLLYAVSLLTCSHAWLATSSVANLIIAQQVAMITALSAASASAAAASC